MMYLLIQNRQHSVRHSLACTKTSSGQGMEIRVRAAQKEEVLNHGVSWLLSSNTRAHCHYPKPMLSEDFISETLFVGNLDVIHAFLH